MVKKYSKYFKLIKSSIDYSKIVFIKNPWKFKLNWYAVGRNYKEDYFDDSESSSEWHN